MKSKIALVEDNTLFRMGLRALLSSQPDFSVCADLPASQHASSAIALLEPDILLMDLRAGGTAGLAAVSQLKRHLLQVRVVLLTSLRTEEYVRAALGVGVDGFVLKDASFDELLMALHSVAAGKKYLSPDVSGHVVESFLHPQAPPARKSGVEMLSSRERGVLQLIAEGRTNRSVAEYLCLSAKTVEKHRSSVMQKLGLRNASELTLAAIEMGLIERPVAISRLVGVSASGFSPLE
jgi:DNA-binding NarL/FixJ family response regulator